MSVQTSAVRSSAVVVSTLIAALAMGGGAGGTTAPGATDTGRAMTSPATTSRLPAASPARPRGGTRVTSSRGYPPREQLPSFKAVRITSANFAAGLAAAPDGRIFYSELWGGRVRVIRKNGIVDAEPWVDVNRLLGIRWRAYYHGGLSGIAFDPAFRRNHFVYLVTQVPSKRNGLPSRTLVLRFTERAGRGTSPSTILSLPAAVFDNTYSLVFGPDGKLYVPTGFLGEELPDRRDPLTDMRGEILRVERNGDAPGDNPWGRRAPRVWATGVKNAFDLAFVPGRKIAIAGESGPEAHDEINLLQRGHNYGYPAYHGARHIPAWITPPLLDYNDDRTSPVGIVYYGGSRHPALRGRYLMCENHGRGMIALHVSVKRDARLLNYTPLVSECTLDVITTADGSIVFSNAEAIYRLEQS